MILLIDNYDSFVHNLARYFRRLGQETLVVRNDAATAATVRNLAPQAIVLSPGPCTPAEAGCSIDVVHELLGEIPLLGVCLGHQAIAAALGAQIVRAKEPRHGRTSLIDHDRSGLFAGMPAPLTVCRYHSLSVDERTLPRDLRVTARADDGEVMALAHVSRLAFGVQFHPEAVLTEHGHRLLANFLGVAGCSVSADPTKLTAGEYGGSTEEPFQAPQRPITF